MKIDVFHGIDTRMDTNNMGASFSGALEGVRACVQVTAQEYYTRGFSQGVANGKAFHNCYGNLIIPFSNEVATAWIQTMQLFRGLMEDNGVVLFDILTKEQKK